MWSSATKDIQLLYNFETTQVALIDFWFLLAYSIAGIFLCQIVDKFNKPKVILIQYTTVAVIVSCLGMCMWIPDEKQKDSVWLYCIIELLNGTVQSMGWAVNLVVLSNWFPRTGRGLLIGCWASNATFGDLVGTQIFKHITTSKADKNWGYGFFAAGAIVFAIGVLNYFVLIEKPADVGLEVEEGGNLNASSIIKNTSQHFKHQSTIRSENNFKHWNKENESMEGLVV